MLSGYFTAGKFIVRNQREGIKLFRSNNNNCIEGAVTKLVWQIVTAPLMH